ncbi:MAG: GIY-YIG nuclease family protein [Chitinophagales bacterium]|nr:GIY-YIG nuclease family protein [Chitinophagales bacterium]
MQNKPFAIVDIETTGGIPGRDSITEIGIVLYDGHKIQKTFTSLINPECAIPYEITRITGITNEMVADAPKFYEVAKQVIELTQDAIFVAHNVRFDYNFIKEAFNSLGYTFTREKLCTVVLSRKHFPGLRSYSLGNLIQHFGISVNNRHRALDDALATTDILQRILSNETGRFQANQLIQRGIQATKLPKNISTEQIEGLPELTGVYYMYNTYGHIIYIGKSINIKKRILQHFSANDSKSGKLLERVADITYQPTGSELLALLLESNEIKAHQPEINKAQRSKSYPYFIYYYTDEQGYIRFEWDKSSVKTRKNKTILNHYSSKNAARSHLFHIVEMATLCPGLTGIYELNGNCFYYQTGTCLGACQGIESPKIYNERALSAIEHLKKSFDESFFIITEGRSEDEAGIILIHEGHYQGFGYLGTDEINTGFETWQEAIQYVPFNPECDQIIHSWIEKHPNTKIVRF